MALDLAETLLWLRKVSVLRRSCVNSFFLPLVLDCPYHLTSGVYVTTTFTTPVTELLSGSLIASLRALLPPPSTIRSDKLSVGAAPISVSG